MPLKTYFMKRSEFITVNSKGEFPIRNLSFPATEITGLFYAFDDLYNQNEYLQYIDPTVFGQGYGTVYTNAIYTIATSSDGSNDQVIKVYPAPPSARIGVDYYVDWPRLGDLSTGSRLQQITLNITGTASQTALLSFSSTINSTTTATTSVAVVAGDTAATVIQKLVAANNVPFQVLPGNNQSYWNAVAATTAGTVTLTSPQYISDTATLNIVNVPTGLAVTPTALQAPFIQTVQTNWYLYNFPYLYYYAALKHAYAGIDDLERYAIAEKETQKALQLFQSFTDRAEFAGSLQQPHYNNNVIW